MDRAQKEAFIASLNGVFKSAGVVVVTHYIGLTVPEITDLRVRMNAAGGQFRVTKNRLTKIALEGTPCASLVDLFSGPTAIGYSEDPVAAPKVIANFAKDNDKLVILGGAMGEEVLDAGRVETLASLPSLDELRGKIVGLVQAPATKVAGVVQAPGGQLARVIAAYGAQGEAA